jgi:predicted transcriptional regulator
MTIGLMNNLENNTINNTTTQKPVDVGFSPEVIEELKTEIEMKNHEISELNEELFNIKQELEKCKKNLEIEKKSNIAISSYTCQASKISPLCISTPTCSA